jgi:hypothetical protein
VGACLVAALAGWPASGLRAAESSVDYLRDIKPILHQRCYACHGALKQTSGLRVDTADALVQGGESGAAVVPGDSGRSLLIEAVTGDLAQWRMPPEGEPLTAGQIALLRRWIDQGATRPADESPPTDPRNHWAFQTPVRPRTPAVGNSARVSNPIDVFLAAEHERLGLHPVEAAPRHVLWRRVYLDLVGLPPTREEFERSESFEAVVDRLLDAPEHGQRWARHWMDIWRYSDWSGENKNLVRGSPRYIWRWRDWIVESLNEDKGYDRMIREMLAGDELEPANPDVLRATGFLARNWYEFNRNVWLNDTVEHTAKAFLGLTLGCARCHDHKFDPVGQLEFYSWRAIFEPHDVRTDPVTGNVRESLRQLNASLGLTALAGGTRSVPAALAGQTSADQDGLVRVYDGRPEVPTFLFMRGDETRPDKARSLSPAVPTALGGRFEIQPVFLPLPVYYPAILPVNCEELLRLARAEVVSCEAALTTARASKNSRSTSTELAELQLAAAQTELASLEARIAADGATFAAALSRPKVDPVRRDQLAREAAAAERIATWRRSELAVLQGEQRLSAAQRAAEDQPAGKKTAANLAAAEKDLQTARRALAAAQKAKNRTDSSYAPLGPQMPAVSTGRRLALARWITDPANPLTARVAVNHVWLRHFGVPLVDPVDDFGLRTAPPRHQALLDFLAVEFMESGWSFKHLHRLIVTSQAYRRSSSARSGAANNLAIDPENQFLWRMNSRRAEGEVIRDSILHVAGNLDRTPGGPEIPLDQAETSRRRSLYFRHGFERQVPFLEAFDGADVMECYRRQVTVVPQQALALANSALSDQQARELARKLDAQVAPESNADFVRLAFECLLNRAPSDAERERCLRFLTDHRPLGTGADRDARSDATQPARVSLIRVLMNHNDFITIR